MNETLPHHGQDSEGVPTPSETGNPTHVGSSDSGDVGDSGDVRGPGATEPAAAPEAVVDSVARTLPEGELSDTQPRPEPQPVNGTSVMPAYEAAAEAGPGAASPPAFGAEIPQPPAADLPPEVPQQFGADLPAEGPQPFALGLAPETPQPMTIEDGEDDGLPGGPTPASSGFSWRLPGTPAPAPVAQGGIPNEFDHLFRDSGADARRSLLPGQAPVGVALPMQGPAQGQGSGPGQGPGQGAPGQSGPAYPGGGYQDSEGYPQDPYAQDGYPQQPYLGETGGMYDQSGYQTQAQVPVGAPDAEAHTQAIPRVQVQYGGSGPANPDLLLATGGPSRESSNRTLVIAGGVLVVLVVIAMFAFSGGSKKTAAKTGADAGAPTASAPAGVDPAAKSQADAIYAVIQQSQGLTGKASSAIDAVEKCSNVQQAAATFTDIATKRQAQADAVAALPADKLVNGAQLVSHLQQAWQYSAASERELAAWAQDNATCSGKPTNNDNRKKADADGSKAGSAKTSAADDWNAAAAKAGEPSIKHTDL